MYMCHTYIKRRMGKNIYDASSGKLVRVGDTQANDHRTSPVVGTHSRAQSSPNVHQGPRVSVVQRPQSIPAYTGNQAQPPTHGSQAGRQQMQMGTYRQASPHVPKRPSLDTEIENGDINGETYDDILDAYSQNADRMKIRIE